MTRLAALLVVALATWACGEDDTDRHPGEGAGGEGASLVGEPDPQDKASPGFPEATSAAHAAGDDAAYRQPTAGHWEERLRHRSGPGSTTATPGRATA